MASGSQGQARCAHRFANAARPWTALRHRAAWPLGLPATQLRSPSCLDDCCELIALAPRLSRLSRRPSFAQPLPTLLGDKPRKNGVSDRHIVISRCARAQLLLALCSAHPLTRVIGVLVESTITPLLIIALKPPLHHLLHLRGPPLVFSPRRFVSRFR